MSINLKNCILRCANQLQIAFKGTYNLNILNTLKTAGIDGCKAGWIAVTFDDGNQYYKILRTDDELAGVLESFDRIFIDMPIGLEDELYTRECDELLRKMLGADYAPSVFSPPIRPALHAPSYVEANMQSYEYTEKKLTLQAWNITPKIRILDQFLTENENLREILLESHPELIFMNLNGGRIFQKKNTKKGLRHRLDLITNHEKIASEFFREIKEDFRRNEVDEDDIVDAMALALASKHSVEKGVKTLPENPPKDSAGLRKAIHYI
jgi:predicted RNase H-like nuclease